MDVCRHLWQFKGMVHRHKTTMGHGRRLTEVQVATVRVLHKEKYKPGKIVTRIGESSTAVRNVVGKSKYEPSDGLLGHPRKLTELQARTAHKNFMKVTLPTSVSAPHRAY